MAKIHARNVDLFAGGREISGRSNSATLSQTADSPDVTGFKDDNRERLHGGIRDIDLSANGFFDDSASQVDVVFSGLLNASAQWGIYPEGATGSKGGREFVGILNEYSQDYSTDTAVATAIAVAGSGAVSLVKSLFYGSISAVGASLSSSVDLSGSSASMGAFLRILEIGGTSPIFSASIQHSNDDSAFTTLVEFLNITSACQVFTDTFTSSSQYQRVRYQLAGTGPTAKFTVSTGSYMKS